MYNTYSGKMVGLGLCDRTDVPLEASLWVYSLWHFSDTDSSLNLAGVESLVNQFVTYEIICWISCRLCFVSHL